MFIGKIPLRGDLKSQEDVLAAIRDGRHAVYHDRRQKINQLMRNKDTRKQILSNGLQLDQELEAKLLHEATQIANLDVQHHFKKFENDFSHFRNQAIVNELGEGGPISLDLNKMMPRRASETTYDVHTVDMQ